MLFNSSFPTDLFISSPNLFVHLVYELETSFFIPTAKSGEGRHIHTTDIKQLILKFFITSIISSR